MVTALLSPPPPTTTTRWLSGSSFRANELWSETASSSVSFLPISFIVQSLMVAAPPPVMPATTRGMAAKPNEREEKRKQKKIVCWEASGVGLRRRGEVLCVNGCRAEGGAIMPLMGYINSGKSELECGRRGGGGGGVLE